MNTWKNAIKKTALAVLVAVSAASAIIASAGAFNYAAATEQNLYYVAGALNIVLGLAATYALIKKSQKMDVVNNAKEIK